MFNALLLAFGVPAALAVAAALALHTRGNRVESRFAGIAALLFGFLLVTLEVRQAFHGTVLSSGSASDAEMYAYSLAWIVLALGLLTAGILTRGSVLRYGSAAVMTVAVGKVFLVDMAHLQDLYRVLSFFGLGLSLMLLAWLYQRFVFKGTDLFTSGW